MNIPMLYVNPVTGPFAGRTWLCYVCQYGSAPVLAVFVRPDHDAAPHAVEAAQQLIDKHRDLQSFVVYLSGPDPDLEETIRRLAARHRYTVPLTVLPEQKAVASLYKVLPIRPESPVTALLYRGRQLAAPLHDLRFDTVPGPAALPNFNLLAAPPGDLLLGNAPLPATRGFDGRSLREIVGESQGYQKLAAAAAAMLDAPRP